MALPAALLSLLPGLINKGVEIFDKKFQTEGEKQHALQTHIREVQKQVEEPKPTVLYFKPLSEIEQIEAERLLGVAVPGRSIGRLPMTGFNLMVPNCRQIIEKWPESQYAYQARRLLADLQPRYQTRYNVTKEEINISMFYKQRPGTQPFTMEDSR